MTKTKISVRVPEKLGKDIEKLAEKESCSKASILAQALEAYIERQKWIGEFSPERQ